jgi:hypothetical protein
MHVAQNYSVSQWIANGVSGSVIERVCKDALCHGLRIIGFGKMYAKRWEQCLGPYSARHSATKGRANIERGKEKTRNDCNMFVSCSGLYGGLCRVWNETGGWEDVSEKQ